MNAPAGLLGRLRRDDPTAGFEAVTVDRVAAVVRDGVYVGPHDDRPDAADVLVELGHLAGLPPSAPAVAPDAGPGTRWLRRNTS